MEVSVWYSIQNVTRWVPFLNRNMVTTAPSSARAIIMNLSTWAAGRTMNIVSLRDRCLLSAFLVRLVSYTPWHLRLRMAPSHVSPVITCHSRLSSVMSLSRMSATILTTTLCERDSSSWVSYTSNVASHFSVVAVTALSSLKNTARCSMSISGRWIKRWSMTSRMICRVWYVVWPSLCFALWWYWPLSGSWTKRPILLHRLQRMVVES